MLQFLLSVCASLSPTCLFAVAPSISSNPASVKKPFSLQRCKADCVISLRSRVRAPRGFRQTGVRLGGPRLIPEEFASFVTKAFMARHAALQTHKQLRSCFVDSLSVSENYVSLGPFRAFKMLDDCWFL